MPVCYVSIGGIIVLIESDSTQLIRWCSSVGAITRELLRSERARLVQPDVIVTATTLSGCDKLVPSASTGRLVTLSDEGGRRVLVSPMYRRAYVRVADKQALIRALEDVYGAHMVHYNKGMLVKGTWRTYGYGAWLELGADKLERALIAFRNKAAYVSTAPTCPSNASVDYSDDSRRLYGITGNRSPKAWPAASEIALWLRQAVIYPEHDRNETCKLDAVCAQLATIASV